MKILKFAFLVAIKMLLLPVLFALRIPDIFIMACVRMNRLDMNLIITKSGDMKRIALQPDRLKKGSRSTAVHIDTFSRELDKDAHMFIAKHHIVTGEAQPHQ
ncbi:hypothetical protein [Paenibacillus dendritiformis]|uniref:hypothetical protein n=1 Tax=Paenibacillus dendritiformis TaxID=130049 RepID=UPI0018CEDF12|nr:hypothetical protein [Paenibacillus dendritiformis]